MKLDALKQLYPDSYLTNSPLSDSDCMLFQEKEQLLVIPTGQLTTQERQLLTMIQTEHFPLISHQKSHDPWYQFLFQAHAVPKIKGNFRVLQFLVTQEVKDLSQWLTNLADMFEQTQAHFLVTEKLAIIIEKQSPIIYTAEEIEGILKTLENDFGVRAKGFVGNFMPLSASFKTITQEFVTLFQHAHQQIKNNQVITFEDISLYYLTKESFNQSPWLSYLRQHLIIDDEMKAIILSLWHNQGNISSTAKALFMHRNTLRYRIEKFSEQTSLSLKSMDGLALSYLLVLHHTTN